MSTGDEKERVEFLQGTLDMLVLRTLLLGPAHGHAIAHAIERNSDDGLQVEQGSLYVMSNLCHKKSPMPVAAWGHEGLLQSVSEDDRPARCYHQLMTKAMRELDL